VRAQKLRNHIVRFVQNEIPLGNIIQDRIHLSCKAVLSDLKVTCLHISIIEIKSDTQLALSLPNTKIIIDGEDG
jgi:hypothetical protein